MEARHHDSGSQRQRSDASQSAKTQRSDETNTRKPYSVDVGSWSSLTDNTPPTVTQYQFRQAAVASPSGASTRSVTTPAQHKGKEKQSAKKNDNTPPPDAIASLFPHSHSPLGPSMLSSSSYKSITLNSHFSDGDSDEPARLITYTKHSQGFTWNDELFLPSYLVSRHRYGGGYRSGRRHRGFDNDDMAGQDDDVGDFDEQGDKCPITDIFVTDEEAAAMMP